MATIVGVDIGQKHEPSAICVVETENRTVSGRRATHFLVRYLERLALGTPYIKVGQRLAEITAGISGLGKKSPTIYLDATGLGEPIVKLIEDEIDHRCAVVPVHFNHGDRRSEEGPSYSCVVTLGKAHLVCRLQCLLQASRLHLLSTPAAEVLRKELREFEIKVTEDANDRYGAFKVGTQDDLVTALGLAVHAEPRCPDSIYFI